MNTNLRYGVAGLLIGGLLVWFGTTSVVNTNNQNIMGMMGIRSQRPVAQMSNIDRHFIEQMIPHHEGAIEMANLALQKASHQEIKNLSVSIITSQTAEIIKMREWYKDWFGKELTPEKNLGLGMMSNGAMGMRMHDSDDNFEDLKKSENFDKEFIEEMIPHHQMAVMMASMLQNSTQRDEMKKLAKDIISSQSKEIGEMKKWYVAWGY